MKKEIKDKLLKLAESVAALYEADKEEKEDKEDKPAKEEAPKEEEPKKEEGAEVEEAKGKNAGGADDDKVAALEEVLFMINSFVDAVKQMIKAYNFDPKKSAATCGMTAEQIRELVSDGSDGEEGKLYKIFDAALTSYSEILSSFSGGKVGESKEDCPDCDDDREDGEDK